MTIAFTFPGQGSQSVGMLSRLAGEHAIVKDTFDAASNILGYDLWAIVQEGPEGELNATQRTQPAMLAGGVAVSRVWDELGGPSPEVLAGHSLGEYCALVYAGALGFDVAVELVAARARFMQEAVPQGVGAIAAILGLDDEQVIDVCARAEQDLHVAAVNFNAPGQVAIAGHAEAVDRAIELAGEAGAKRAIRLPLSVPVHCKLMRPAAERFTEVLAAAEIRAPRIPVIHNVDVTPRTQPDDIREALAAQVFSPVQWAATIRQFAVLHVETLVELGPGKVLSGLARRIDRSMAAVPAFDPTSLSKALEQAENCPIDAYWADDARMDEREAEQSEARDIAHIRAASGWTGMYFGGVAFKKQRPVESSQHRRSAQTAKPFMDVVTTSGIATGHEAEDSKITDFRAGLGDAPLALASGITPKNAARYGRDVDCFLVATGINRDGDFYNIDRRSAWDMQSDGTYVQRRPASEDDIAGVQVPPGRGRGTPRQGIQTTQAAQAENHRAPQHSTTDSIAHGRKNVAERGRQGSCRSKGLWTAEIHGPERGWENAGVIVLRDGHALGGGRHHYSVGTYNCSGEDFSMSLAIDYHGPPRTLFGTVGQEAVDQCRR